VSSDFDRATRGGLPIRKVEHADDKPIVEHPTDGASHAEFRIIRMWCNHQRIESHAITFHGGRMRNTQFSLRVIRDA
jgi:hypothetical protein